MFINLTNSYLLNKFCDTSRHSSMQQNYRSKKNNIIEFLYKDFQTKSLHLKTLKFGELSEYTSYNDMKSIMTRTIKRNKQQTHVN